MFRPTLTIICFFEVCKNLSYLSLWVPRGTYAIQLPILFMCRHLAGSKKIIFIRMSWRRRMKFTFLTIDTRWSRSTTVQFLCSDWSKFDRWVHAENLYSTLNLVYFQFDSWSWQSILSTCDVFLLSFSTGCIKWNTAAINSLLLFMAGLFIDFLVEKCAPQYQSRKSDFGWHRFRFSPCGMRVEKSLKRFWPYLIAFRSFISNGKPEWLLYM